MVHETTGSASNSTKVEIEEAGEDFAVTDNGKGGRSYREPEEESVGDGMVVGRRVRQMMQLELCLISVVEGGQL